MLFYTQLDEEESSFYTTSPMSLVGIVLSLAQSFLLIFL